MRASTGVTFSIGRQSKSVWVGDEQSIFFFFFAKIPLFHHRRIKSVFNSVNFEIDKVYFHKQGQVFKPSAVANH